MKAFKIKAETFFRVDFINQAIKEVELGDEANARAVAAKFARGNVPMQHGYFQTPKQLESERREAAHLKF